jgi:diaminopimelate decarboxylase
MDHFTHVDGVLRAEGVAIPDIAEAVGTPFYVYSTATLTRHYRLFEEALAGRAHLVCYAVKACSNLAVLRTLARLGAGMDVVSEGELRRALAAGVAPEKIVFAGVGKTETEMRFALDAGIGQFNVESEPELRALDSVGRAAGRRAPVAIRVNPDVDAGTHEKISTGKSENKFGIPIDQAPEIYALARALPWVEVIGVAVHIGSQLTALQPFDAAFRKVASLARALRAQGHAIRRVDLGGGLGIPYVRSNEAPPLPFDYGAVVKAATEGLDAELVIEPGRLIAGNAGLLVSRVIYRKEGAGRTFLILDAAMNDLLRPALYDAWHDIVPVREPRPDAPLQPVDVVGPVCETGDTFARARPLPPLKAGDLVAFRSAGAYGAAMASEYNSRPLVPEVIVKGDRFDLSRPRPTYDEMIARERIPDWLG